MSPWPCRSLVATLSPDQVSVVLARNALTRRGLERVVEWQHVVAVQPESDAPGWRTALETLASALPGRTRAIAGATVVLSNRFLSYLLVPPDAELANRRELLAYARHRFSALHGASGDDMDVRLSACASGGAALASSVDARLVSGLHDLFRRAGVRLASVQPRLMAAANGAARHIASGDAWLALAEPGSLCLALLRRGQWRRLRTTREEGPWREHLCVLLDRERYQDDSAALPEDVYVWHAREAAAPLPQNGGWRFHAVPSRRGADPAPASSTLP